jgi:hypothetical protein
MHNNVIILIVLIGFFIFSCDGSTDDIEAPVVNIIQPVENDTIVLSTTSEINIRFTASDNDELHDVIVYVKNTSGQILYSTTKDVDQKSYNYSERYKPSNINSITQLKLETHITDHSDNHTFKSVSFFVRP